MGECIAGRPQSRAPPILELGKYSLNGEHRIWEPTGLGAYSLGANNLGAYNLRASSFRATEFGAGGALTRPGEELTRLGPLSLGAYSVRATDFGAGGALTRSW